MDARKLIWFGAIAGSTLGGCVPTLWHGSAFSLGGLVLATIGGLAGIWAAYRFTR